jgi:hypothetical protein
MTLGNWEDTCSLCNRSRFWPSKSGYFVCAICTPDPLDALETLGRRVPGGVRVVQAWRQQALVGSSTSSTL